MATCMAVFSYHARRQKQQVCHFCERYNYYNTHADNLMLIYAANNSQLMLAR